MKYPQIDSKLFIENRARFIKQLKPNSIAIFNSNYEYVWNGDSSHTFKQHSDMIWLSGIDQEDSILVIYPDCPIPDFREVLFLKQTNEHIAVWEGHKYTKEEATSASGIKSIFWNNEFEAKIRQVVNLADNIYLPLNENNRFGYKSPYKDLDFAHEMKSKFPLHNYERTAPILHRLRSIKSETELALMRTAAGISKKGFERLLHFVKPGVWEHEVEAELIHEYIRSRANGHSFAPIVASGASACVLHYVENNKQCKDGDLLLVDCGVDYANYSSDMTRTFPVNGRYTARQKQVYNAVLRVQREAKKMLVPGTLWPDFQKNVEEIMAKELIDLGLLTTDDIKNQDPKWPAVKKYFPHGNSHFLGIEVHDVGRYHEPMQEGMVFSNEPGIYIPEEGIGIRIENSVLITDNGGVDFMDEINIPIETEAIEDMMNSGR